MRLSLISFILMLVFTLGVVTSCQKLPSGKSETAQQEPAESKTPVAEVKKDEQKSEEATPIAHSGTEQVVANVSEIEKQHQLEIGDVPYVEHEWMEAKARNTKKVLDYCKKIDKSFHRWGWGRSKCHQTQWIHVRNSVNGLPLIWTVFGDESLHNKEPKNMTLILCGVHGDEITPVKFCFDIIAYLKKLEKDYPNRHRNLIAVAPIVSPDSYFKKYPSRTNAKGVDVNRNFPTRDWHKKALKTWRNRYRSDKRRFPGWAPKTEPEVVFQVNLIKRYQPDKIISVHAPLTIIDYDGPSDHHHGGKKFNQLLIQLSEKANGYRIKDYPYFPGSLGNYAGNERGIPTYTLELPSSDNRRHREFWKFFRHAIEHAIFHEGGGTNGKDKEVAHSP